MLHFQRSGKELARSCQLSLILFCSVLITSCATYLVPDELKEDYLSTTGYNIHGTENRRKLTVWNLYKLPNSSGDIESVRFIPVASSERSDKWSVHFSDQIPGHERQEIQAQLDKAANTLSTYHLETPGYKFHFRSYIVPPGIEYEKRYTTDLVEVTDFDIYQPAGVDAVSSMQKVIGTTAHEKFHLFSDLDVKAAQAYGDLYQMEAMAYLVQACVLSEVFGAEHAKESLYDETFPENLVELLKPAQTAEEDARIIDSIIVNYNTFQSRTNENDSYLERTVLGRVYVIYKLYSGLKATQSEADDFVWQQCQLVLVDQDHDQFLEQLLVKH